jgi:4-amino-4-deoxy-L-arabinose transferase-like glycosyltransferase
LLLDREALLGGLLLAFSLGSVVYSLYILTETLFTLLLLGMTYALAVYWRKTHSRWLIGAGLLAGTAMLCRPVALFYPLVAAPLVACVHRDRWRQTISAALLFLTITTLVVAPWMFRNCRLVGSPTLSSITSYNLLFYNAVSLEADLRDVGQAQVRAEMAERVKEELARRGKIDDIAFQVRLYNEWSRKIILAHPWRYLYVHLKGDLNSLLPNITEFLELMGVTQGGKDTLSVLNQYGLWAAVRHYFRGQMWLPWLLLPLVGLLGLIYLCMLVGSATVARRRAWSSLALLFLPIAYFLLIPGAPSHPRFRVPVMPYMCLLAGTGVVTVWRWVRQRLRRPSSSACPVKEVESPLYLFSRGSPLSFYLAAGRVRVVDNVAVE